MQASKQPTAQAGILNIAPYVPGKAKAAGDMPVIKLASNEGALGPSPKAAEAVQQAALTAHRYPDGGAVALRQALAQRWDLDAERIVCGAGSDELISLLCQAYAGVGDEVLYSQYGFLMYPISAQAAGATAVQAPAEGLETSVDNLLAAVTERTKLLFVANPNNPTGTWLNYAELERLVRGVPSDVVVVIDAAYAEFMLPDGHDPLEAELYQTGAGLVEAYPNVVMTRTFSKLYALGGLRLGWAYCPEAIADVLNRVRGPFNVSNTAQAAGIAALADRAFEDLNRAHNSRWRDWTRTQLELLDIACDRSGGNFLLPDFSADLAKGETAAILADALEQRAGIVVRDMAGYGLPNHLRVSIGTEAEMTAFIKALALILDERRRSE